MYYKTSKPKPITEKIA